MVSLTIDEPGVAVAGAAAAPADDARLARAVGEHYDFVWRSLKRLGVPASDAEDAAQEVFLTLSRRLTDVPAQSERSLVYRTAVTHAAHGQP